MAQAAGLDMLKSKFMLVALLVLGSAPLFAADCPVPQYAAPPPAQVVDWYTQYIEPSRAVAGLPVNPRPFREVVEALVGQLDEFHRRSTSESLYFEPLVKQLNNSYAGAGDFKGLNTAVAEKLYGPARAPVWIFRPCASTRGASAFRTIRLQSRCPASTFKIAGTSPCAGWCSPAR